MDFASSTTAAKNRSRWKGIVAPTTFQGYGIEFGWLVGCFGFNGPLKQYFSLYRAVSHREGERGEKR